MTRLIQIACLFPLSALSAEPARCDRIQAEFQEMAKLSPHACDESKEVHQRYQRSYAEVNELCRRIERKAGPELAKLKTGSDDQMRLEAMELRQKDMEERATITNKLAHELLLTPIDTDSPTRPPLLVADACRDELDAYAKVRRIVLNSFSRFFQQIDGNNESLFQQAAEKR